MKIITKLKWLIVGCSLAALLSSCGGQYAGGGGEPSCTWNTTACTPPAAFTCCSNWGQTRPSAPEPEQR